MHNPDQSLEDVEDEAIKMNRAELITLVVELNAGNLVKEQYIAGLENWIPITERMPEDSGTYLCKTSDGWKMVCFLDTLGKWMLWPGGSYHGDLCGADDRLGAGRGRTITHWRLLPK